MRTIFISAFAFSAGILVQHFGPVLNIDGRDPGVHLNLTPDSGEGYVVAMQKTPMGHEQKIGVVAMSWADRARTVGTVNLHSTYFDENGRAKDDIWLLGFAKRGVTIFPPDTSLNSSLPLSPGKGVLWINGRVVVGPQGKALDFHEEIAALKARIAKLERVRR